MWCSGCRKYTSTHSFPRTHVLKTNFSILPNLVNLRASRFSRTRKTPALQAKSDEELLGVRGVRLVKVAPYSFMTAHKLVTYKHC